MKFDRVITIIALAVSCLFIAFGLLIAKLMTWGGTSFYYELTHEKWSYLFVLIGLFILGLILKESFFQNSRKNARKELEWGKVKTERDGSKT